MYWDGIRPVDQSKQMTPNGPTVGTAKSHHLTVLLHLSHSLGSERTTSISVASNGKTDPRRSTKIKRMLKIFLRSAVIWSRRLRWNTKSQKSTPFDSLAHYRLEKVFLAFT